ncbi:hypothetical protein MPLA_1620045 [Mesorhizobium sp. ORS 3359]|nr:hypothetical protein MPLA_1620045 [Mesorhizobium sp. ORS 3359]
MAFTFYSNPPIQSSVLDISLFLTDDLNNTLTTADSARTPNASVWKLLRPVAKAPT